jgi:hypothetical protein
MTSTMVEPGATLTGAADDTAVEPTTSPVANPPSGSRGWSSYSNNKKLAIGGGVGALIGLGIYLWRKRKADAAVGAAPAPSSSSATGAGNTAPEYVLPSSNQDSVVGANDAALDTALGSIGTTLNTIGNDVNHPPPTVVTTTTTGTPPATGTSPQPPTIGGPGMANQPLNNSQLLALLKTESVSQVLQQYPNTSPGLLNQLAGPGKQP